MRRRDVLRLGLAATAAQVGPAFAQEPYPSRPIRLVIPSVPAGGGHMMSSAGFGPSG